MATLLADASAKELERMLNEGQAEVTEAILKLRQALCQYGFRGTITCTIGMVVRDDYDDVERARTERKIQYEFKR